MSITKFTNDIIELLKYYVYIYIDPQTNEIFYVGKGKGNRIFSHLNDDKENEKNERIKEILARGQKTKIEILIHGLEDEDSALKVEAAVIDLIGVDNLTNKVHGYKSNLYGRMSVDQLVQRYKKEKVNIDVPAILIRINRRFHYGMTPVELYDATRGCWVLGNKREKVKYAIAVYDGIIQEVYTVLQWFKAGQTFMIREDDRDGLERWEFIGNVAPDNIRSKYLNKYVSHYFKPGNQNPVVYVNI